MEDGAYDDNDNTRCPGRGRGRGYHRLPGRGRGGGRFQRHPRDQSDKANPGDVPSNESDHTHNVDNENRNTVFDDSDNSSNNHSHGYSNVCYNITNAQNLRRKPHNTIIIDSRSTTDTIATESMVHDIHTSSKHLNVHTINGHTIIRKKAYLGDYPPPLWFYPSGGVNLLSFNNVQKYYRYTMDTNKHNAIFIHLDNGKKLKFQASSKGLYQYKLKEKENIENILTLLTVRSEDSLPLNPKTCFNIHTSGIDTVNKRADK